MGVALYLLPEQRPNQYPALARTVLPLSLRDYDFFEVLKAESFEEPEGLMWYDDNGLEEFHTDSYGDPITYVSASTFLRLVHSRTIQQGSPELGPWNRACIAFIEQLPPDNRIYLWFH